ncbi:hypothetical protein NL676_006085 [Syzygium grande]|nr:hypothetical protein NL676_006085 [Syzygium grande]
MMSSSTARKANNKGRRWVGWGSFPLYSLSLSLSLSPRSPAPAALSLLLLPLCLSGAACSAPRRRRRLPPEHPFRRGPALLRPSIRDGLCCFRCFVAERRRSTARGVRFRNDP